MSARIVGNSSLTTFDVLIVGSGAGAGPVAYLCAKNGLKVLVLEAGPNHYDHLDDPAQQPVPEHSNDELKYQVRSFIDVDARMDPRSWRVDTSTDRVDVTDVNGLPKHVGGGMVHADVKMPRYEAQDFQMATLLGNKVQNANFADWPITYADLEPYYAYAEVAVGVQGKKGANPFEPPRSTEYPMPPGLPMYLNSIIAKGLGANGYTIFPYPTAVNSEPYDGRPACNDCGYCSDYGCPNNAKGSTAVTMLRKALLTGNCLLLAETRVTKLIMNGAKDTVTAVECVDPTGQTQQYSAARYVLAASPIEDARILLLSDPSGTGVGNSSDMVGRNLMFHLQTSCVGIFNDRLHGHRGRTVDHGFADFRGIAANYDPNDPSKSLGGIVEISGSERPVNEASYYTEILLRSQFKFDGRLFKKLMRQSPFRDRIIVLTMQAEDAPQAINRVDLDPQVVDFFGTPAARVTYANHPYELAASSYYAPIMQNKIFKDAGARWAAVTPRDTIPASAHIMGTLRFGTDPTKSVCDPTGKFHDIQNLYCSDGALFPTSSGYNPTMTICALSCWVGANMVNPTSPSTVIS
ncbi:MAG TPA: GMC family oxidoreductase [Polyangiaceae bacterium]|jgi:gluconate 2-dehydrogenase alpha chain